MNLHGDLVAIRLWNSYFVSAKRKVYMTKLYICVEHVTLCK